MQTLNLFVRNKNFINILENLVNNHFENLISLIPEVKNKFFFDLIMEIVKNYDIDVFILPLIKLLT